MKYKDYFIKLKEQGKIANEAYDKFVDSAPDGEIPDDVFQILDNTFLTVERAQSHKDVVGKIKGETLDPINNDINALFKSLPAETVLELEKFKGNTFKQMAVLREAIPAAIQKAAKSGITDEEVKKKLNDKQAIVDDLMKKLETVNAEKEQVSKTVSSEWEKKLTDYKLSSELEKISQSYTFAEAYEPNRPLLTKALLSELRAQHDLEYGEKEGSPTIQVMETKEGVRGPKFNGNTPVTIKSILDEVYKPLLKVSNAGEPPRRETQQFRVEDSRNTASRGGAPVSAQV